MSVSGKVDFLISNSVTLFDNKCVSKWWHKWQVCVTEKKGYTEFSNLIFSRSQSDKKYNCIWFTCYLNAFCGNHQHGWVQKWASAKHSHSLYWQVAVAAGEMHYSGKLSYLSLELEIITKCENNNWMWSIKLDCTTGFQSRGRVEKQLLLIGVKNITVQRLRA